MRKSYLVATVLAMVLGAILVSKASKSFESFKARNVQTFEASIGR